MAKEDIFGGFDLFNPTSKLKTPDPSDKDLNGLESIKTQEQLDKEAQLEFDKNVQTKADKTIEPVVQPVKGKEIVKDEPKVDPVVKTDPIIKDEPKEEPFSYKPLVKYLSEQGVVEIDEKDIEALKDDESALEEVIGKTITNNIERGVNSYKDKFNPEVQELLKFVELGGNPKDFYDVYYGNTSFETMKVSSEDAQKFVIRQGLRLSGFDDAEVEDELKDIEDLGKLEAKSLVHLRKLQMHEKEQKSNLMKIQQESDKIKKDNNTKYWTDLKGELDKKDAIQGFKLTQKDKDQLWEYISIPDRKTGKTKLQEHNETNKDAQFLYAYLAQKNWDITKLETAATTKATSALRSTLGQFTDSRQKLAGARDNAKEELDTTDPFGGFEKLKLK